MKISLLVTLLIAGSATAGEYRVWGHDDQDSHFVSATELIGRPEFFSGQPVSAVGVVQFRKHNQPVFRLYATSEDLQNSTPAAVKIGSFARTLTISDEDLASLNGKTVVIEGTFQMFERPKLVPGAKPSHVCMTDCGVPGEILNITQITTWPP